MRAPLGIEQRIHQSPLAGQEKVRVPFSYPATPATTRTRDFTEQVHIYDSRRRGATPGTEANALHETIVRHRCLHL
jgi:hypothetical protein